VVSQAARTDLAELKTVWRLLPQWRRLASVRWRREWFRKHRQNFAMLNTFGRLLRTGCGQESGGGAVPRCGGERVEAMKWYRKAPSRIYARPNTIWASATSMATDGGESGRGGEMVSQSRRTESCRRSIHLGMCYEEADAGRGLAEVYKWLSLARCKAMRCQEVHDRAGK